MLNKMPRRAETTVMLVVALVGMAMAMVALSQLRTTSMLLSRANLDEKLQMYRQAERAIDQQQKAAWKHFKRARAQALEVRDAPNRLAGYSVPGTPTQSPPPPMGGSSSQGDSNRLAGFSVSGKQTRSEGAGTPLLHMAQLGESIGNKPVKKIQIKIDEHRKPEVLPVRFSKKTLDLFKALEEQAHTGLQQPRKNAKLYAKADSIMSINTKLPPSKTFVSLQKQVEDIGFEQDRFHYNK